MPAKLKRKVQIKARAAEQPQTFFGLVFLFSFLLFYFGAPPVMNDPGTPLHIAAGQLIRQLGKVPMTDPWSFASTLERWYNIAWGWDVLVGVVTNVAGLAGLFIFVCVWKALLIMGLAALLRKLLGEMTLALVVTVAIAALALMAQPGAHPLLITEALALVFLHLCEKSRQRHSITLFLALPLVMVLWVNVHVGFLVGFVILAAYIIEAFLEDNRDWLLWLLWVGILSAAASFLTPLGVHMPYAIFRNIETTAVVSLPEWGSLGFGLFVFAMAIAGGLRDPSLPKAERVLAFFWLVATLFSARNFHLAVLMAAPYMARALSEVLPQMPPFRFSPLWLKKATALAVAITIPAMVMMPIREMVSASRVMDTKEAVPMEALNFIRKQYPGLRFLNDPRVGGYMVFYNRDVHKVFTDDRAGAAYSDADLEDVKHLVNGTDTGAVVEKYKFQGIFMVPWARTYDINEIYNSKEWKRVYADAAAEVYIRRAYAAQQR